MNATTPGKLKSAQRVLAWLDDAKLDARRPQENRDSLRVAADHLHRALIILRRDLNREGATK